ncbi:CBASS cGAMP synthase [Paenibacillus thailandensis]|uniref:Cyclic GMP-AMP synthase n=1 Tax=Paenibacillus thailandensis TaxID=393250 RepID=A0ABW5QW90_9BACL
MSNCHDLFIKFHDDEIYLKSDKKESLRKSRNALRDKIKKYFSEELDVKKPKFYGQGSYMMNTTVTPIDGEYDIDDGIYLEHLKDSDEGDWPTPSTVHSWIVKATKGHTSEDPVDKNTCVRVIYKANYHVDLPIYIKKDDQSPKLAHKSKGWITSDPKALTDWFKGEVQIKGDQLKRLVRYLKAWKDYKESDTKFPSGMILTILAANHFVSDYPDEDDAALVATAKEIHNTLSESFSLVRPVVPGEELFDNWSETRRSNFLNKLEDLIKKGGEALENQDKTEASKKWRKIFGSRFPEYQPPEDENKGSNSAIQTTSAAVLGNHGRSA